METRRSLRVLSQDVVGREETVSGMHELIVKFF